MVRVVIVGGAGSESPQISPTLPAAKYKLKLKSSPGVGHSIVEELVSQGKHEVTVWTRRVRPTSTKLADFVFWSRAKNTSYKLRTRRSSKYQVLEPFKSITIVIMRLSF